MLELSDITTPSLAYLGDCVIEMCVRRYLVCERGLSTSAHLNKAALQYVTAAAQADAMTRIEPYLTPDESAVFKRGRNIGHCNVPKSATVQQYRRATGMEVLFGYLSVSGQDGRIDFLFRVGYGIASPAPVPDNASDVSDTTDKVITDHKGDN